MGIRINLLKCCSREKMNDQEKIVAKENCIIMERVFWNQVGANILAQKN